MKWGGLLFFNNIGVKCYMSKPQGVSMLFTLYSLIALIFNPLDFGFRCVSIYIWYYIAGNFYVFLSIKFSFEYWLINK